MKGKEKEMKSIRREKVEASLGKKNQWVQIMSKIKLRKIFVVLMPP